MEGIGSEVSHKIRAAIKAKLIELGAYVDDELPDYIMVMVANKRTRAQMDEDLQLFLSSNTKKFTSWLHTVLQKLQEVTVSNFENKKESESKKPSKSKGDDGKSRKSSEEPSEKSKKHAKKHKDLKKGKKTKHKAKEKVKEKKEGESKTSQEKNKNVELNEAVGRAILGDLKRSKQLKSETSSRSSSSLDNESQLNKKNEKEKDKEDTKEGQAKTESVKHLGTELESSEKSKAKVIEDDFNIEPLKPSEENDKVLEPKPDENKEIQVEKTISAPTKELLRKHNKIENEKFEKEGKQTESEGSLSPQEIRKQLLLSRAKKKLEESQKLERMRSNSPDVLIVEETRQTDFFSSKREETRSSESPRRSKRSLHSDRRSQSSERSTDRKGDTVDGKIRKAEGKSSEKWKSREKDGVPEGGGKGEEKKKNVIKISESLELEKNLGGRKDTEGKSKAKETSKKKPIPSRVVTITGPEAPEIPSIVKVKPREFISKDKQANKNLILKAVADAEKSIATVQSRREPDLNPEPKKEALYTKKLREKRFEKLAITLSNIRPNPDGRGGRRVSIDSEKSDKRLGDSSYDSGARGKSDNLSRKISKSEDQFISSKTSVMEKNDKYIRCWLEGVEKAVKDDEMVNPGEMDDFVHQHLTDDEVETDGAGKKRKLTEITSDVSTKVAKPNDEPQIVVTLDGLDSKVIKELILKNKDSEGKPLLSSTGKNDRTATGKVGPEPRKSGVEKMSDRFGRLNKTIEVETGEAGKRKEKPKTTTTESKNRQLIAQLSEKFGKVDREFENRKRKRTDDDRRCLLESRRIEKEDNERNGRYRKTERRTFREGQPQSSKYETSFGSDRYFHPKKCKFDGDCQNPKCEFVHSSENKPRWRSKA